ncbi:hypothetical protein EIJ81_17110 [Aliivibrio salmonicida]|nr:hypothetical protein EIJ81_17110 [Aliivibrio salmonicida]
MDAIVARMVTTKERRWTPLGWRERNKLKESAYYQGFDAWSTISSGIAASKVITPLDESLAGFFLFWAK